MRSLVAALCLAAALPAAAETDAPDAAERRASRREGLEQQLASKKEKRALLVNQRDAARVKANTYVLPAYKLEAQKKQDEIDAVDAEIAALEKSIEALAE